MSTTPPRWKNDYLAGMHGKKKAHETETMRQLTQKRGFAKKKGGKNEHHPSTQKKGRKKRWKKWGPPLHAEKMITWHGKKKAHETKAMKQLALKRDLVSQKKSGKNEHHPSSQKRKKKNGKKKKGAKNDPPPPPKKVIWIGIFSVLTIQSISHFGLVIFMGPDQKSNP